MNAPDLGFSVDLSEEVREWGEGASHGSSQTSGAQYVLISILLPFPNAVFLLLLLRCVF